MHLARITFPFLLLVSLAVLNRAAAQTNLLLNGGFEDVNTCTEYDAECGVEGWFYLKDVKAQMLNNDNPEGRFGRNTFGINFNWLGYTGFSPVIGTLLPCNLQPGRQYIFRGEVSALLNSQLELRTGVCLGERFYVPNRPFAKTMKPDSIVNLKPIPETNLYTFEYRFTATGREQYLTFGTYIWQDSTNGKKQLTGIPTVSLKLDNFQLLSEDKNEQHCDLFASRKEKIYNYNYRHKEMDYSLYGKGELNIRFEKTDSGSITRVVIPQIPRADTLKLGDVLFDFNKANLKPAATNILAAFFLQNKSGSSIDSIYVEGHTDSIGTDKRNMTLSQERCEAVRQWLLLNSVAVPGIIQVHPFGKTRPVASNSTPEGRALNRRVELIVFRRQEN